MASVVGLGLSDPGPDADARLTRPTMVALDFRDSPLVEVFQVLAQRSGKRVSGESRELKDANGVVIAGPDQDISWLNRRVTLDLPQQVPFWEAIDRLAAAGGLEYRVADNGEIGAASNAVGFVPDGEGPGLASYAGPFRVGLLRAHSDHDFVWARGRWIRVDPTGDSGKRGPVSAPGPGDPFYLELNVAAEPDLICERNGPLKALEIVDEFGQSLVATYQEEPWRSFRAFSIPGEGFGTVIRVPLNRTNPGKKSKTIKRFRGVIPVVIGTLEAEPSVVVRLGTSEGNVLRGGGAVWTVTKDRIDAGGRLSLALTCRLDQDFSPAVRESRLSSLRVNQLRLVDAEGALARSTSSSSQGDGRGTLAFTFEYVPGIPGRKPPAEFRYHDLHRIEWEIPFEFPEIPLP